MFRHIFERVVATCMASELVRGEGFAVDASVMEANASRYHGRAPEEIVWAQPERQTRAVREYLAALEADAVPNPDRKPPKVISPPLPRPRATFVTFPAMVHKSTPFCVTSITDALSVAAEAISDVRHQATVGVLASGSAAARFPSPARPTARAIYGP